MARDSKAIQNGFILWFPASECSHDKSHRVYIFAGELIFQVFVLLDLADGGGIEGVFVIVEGHGDVDHCDLVALQNTDVWAFPGDWVTGNVLVDKNSAMKNGGLQAILNLVVSAANGHSVGKTVAQDVGECFQVQRQQRDGAFPEPKRVGILLRGQRSSPVRWMKRQLQIQTPKPERRQAEWLPNGSVWRDLTTFPCAGSSMHWLTLCRPMSSRRCLGREERVTSKTSKVIAAKSSANLARMPGRRSEDLVRDQSVDTLTECSIWLPAQSLSPLRYALRSSSVGALCVARSTTEVSDDRASSEVVGSVEVSMRTAWTTVWMSTSVKGC